MRNKFTITKLCIITLAITCNADDEVQLKSKSYEPRKNLTHSKHRSRAYQTSPARTLDSKQAEQTSGQWWKIFSSRKPEPVSAPLSGTASVKSAPLRQDKQITAVTMKAVPQSVTEKKPYETNVSKTDKDYTPDNRPRPKNPLLRPRQNIKEPQ
ncbi:MAG: hypothetical protein PHU80_07695 [Kiritimatiellae bacterium]|nr:hypothetical protein [Kiritimatiellia bacterium]